MRVVRKALTFDDVLLVPAHSLVVPRDVSLKTRLTRSIALNIPLALVGGIAGLWLTGQNLSVPSSVGFIAWVERCSSRTPSARSSACNRRLTVGWVVSICAAAADRLPASTIRTKVCISSSRSDGAALLWGGLVMR